jgi:hypothetical protein
VDLRSGAERRDNPGDGVSINVFRLSGADLMLKSL